MTGKTASGLSPVTLAVARQQVAPTSDLEQWAAEGQRIWRVVNRSAWDLGDWWNAGEPYGERVHIAEEIGFDHGNCRNAGWVASQFDVSRRRDTLSFSHHQEVVALETGEQDTWLDTAEAERWSQKQLREALRGRGQLTAPPVPTGTYQTLVINPPWPMDKIEREVRPKQGGVIEYGVMGLDEIARLDVPSLAAPNGCHLYLWTTHKFLPTAISLVEEWGFNYQCLLTWVKNVGMTPFSFMYSTEHVVFARKGDLDLLKLGERLDFAAPATGHSRKPESFYELVARVSPGPRLDMFSRTTYEGFEPWGNEAGKFDA